MRIEVDQLTVHAGDFTLKEASFKLETGRYGILMGRTGSGKTTLLEAICGLKTPHSGRILFGGQDVTFWKPAERGIGFVPQEGALFDGMTVEDHLAFALRIRKWSDELIQDRVQELAKWLGILLLLKRYPHGLSGGERQRVALGRAMSFKPEALCLDEPLSALDQPTRHAICDTLQQIKEETQLTILHITHSLDEAQRLLDDLYLMSEGRLRESTESEKHSLVHLKDTSLAELFEPRLEPDSGLSSKNAQ